MKCFALQDVSDLSRTKCSARTFAAFHCTVIGHTLQHLGYSTQNVAGLSQGVGEDLECVSSPSMTREQLHTLWRTRKKQRGLL